MLFLNKFFHSEHYLEISVQEIRITFFYRQEFVSLVGNDVENYSINFLKTGNIIKCISFLES